MSAAPPIRPAEAGDAGALHALIESAYRGASARRGWTHEADMLGGQRTDQEALEGMLCNPAQRILVVGEAAPFAGCVCITHMGAGVCELGMLAVSPDQQAGGLGRALIEAAEQAARTVFSAATMEMTVIHSRGELIAWYNRRGYVDTGRRKPFPMHDRRFGIPQVDDLHFVVLARSL